MSAFIVNQVFSDLIISTYVEQKYYGTKESQEKYLESVLKIRAEFYRLKEKYGTTDVVDVYLESTERGLNNAVEFIQDVLKVAETKKPRGDRAGHFFNHLNKKNHVQNSKNFNRHQKQSHRNCLHVFLCRNVIDDCCHCSRHHNQKHIERSNPGLERSGFILSLERITFIYITF